MSDLPAEALVWAAAEAPSAGWRLILPLPDDPLYNPEKGLYVIRFAHRQQHRSFRINIEDPDLDVGRWLKQLLNAARLKQDYDFCVDDSEGKKLTVQSKAAHGGVIYFEMAITEGGKETSVMIAIRVADCSSVLQKMAA